MIRTALPASLLVTPVAGPFAPILSVAALAARMMEDFLAQRELAKRLNKRPESSLI